MTLTVSLLADGLIVQSADHRLVQMPSRALYDDAEPKQLMVQVFAGAFAVCFAGVGAIAQRGRTSNLVYGAIAQAPGKEVAFDQLAEVLRRAGTRWLRGQAGAPHSFVLAGFESTDAEVVTRVALISNYQSISGPEGPRLALKDGPVSSEFVITSAVVTEPAVLVGGMHLAVSESDCLRLTRLVRNRRLCRQLAAAMAQINRDAAARKEARGYVSPHCTTIELLVGRTQINAMTRGHTDTEQEVVTPTAMPGFDLRDRLAKAVEQIWEQEGFTGTPVQRPSTSAAISLPHRTHGSPYANKDEPLLT